MDRSLISNRVIKLFSANLAKTVAHKTIPMLNSCVIYVPINEKHQMWLISVLVQSARTHVNTTGSHSFQFCSLRAPCVLCIYISFIPFIWSINKYTLWYSVKFAVESVEMSGSKNKLFNRTSSLTWNEPTNKCYFELCVNFWAIFNRVNSIVCAKPVGMPTQRERERVIGSPCHISQLTLFDSWDLWFSKEKGTSHNGSYLLVSQVIAFLRIVSNQKHVFAIWNNVIINQMREEYRTKAKYN